MESDIQQHAFLKDLELQWNDHFHMRDQSWKTLYNTFGLFFVAIALEFQHVGNIVLVHAYILLILVASCGLAIAAHHRVRQKQKFDFIRLCEEQLGILQFKKAIIEKADKDSGFAGRIFTVRFIELDTRK